MKPTFSTRDLLTADRDVGVATAHSICNRQPGPVLFALDWLP
jgi:hypothetical protein